jgi:hypothetical protein
MTANQAFGASSDPSTDRSPLDALGGSRLLDYRGAVALVAAV